MLRAEGHEVTFLTGSVFRDRIESSEAKFVSLPPGADFDGRDILSVAPELKNIPPGLEWFRVAIERFFLDHIPAQHRGLLQAVQECRADVIVGDDMFFGVLPMLLGSQSKRPPIVLCGTSRPRCISSAPLRSFQVRRRCRPGHMTSMVCTRSCW
jgi:hypothetical protein